MARSRRPWGVVLIQDASLEKRVSTPQMKIRAMVRLYTRLNRMRYASLYVDGGGISSQQLHTAYHRASGGRKRMIPNFGTAQPKAHFQIEAQ